MHPDPVIKYYDDLAPAYDKDRFANTYGQYIDKQEKRILEKLLHNKNEIVLDLACGSGRLLSYANYGADGSEKMVEVAKKKFPEKTIFHCDAEQLPLTDASVDVIFTFHFFMHLNHEKIEKILKEAHRVLKPGGRIIFDIPSKKRRRLIKYKTTGWHGAQSYSRREIKALLPDDFTLERSFGILLFPIHRFPKGLRKFLSGADHFMGNYLVKEYCSYFILELRKK